MSTAPDCLASVDGEIMLASQATIAVTDEGLVRGDGAFEVIRVYDGVPFAVEQHFARLQRSADNLRLPADLTRVRAELDALLRAAGPEHPHAQVRIMLTRGGRTIALTEPLHQTPPTARLKTIVYSPTWVLDGVKSLSYAANMLAGRLAVEQGYDEALLVSPEGHVLEAPTSSLFWTKDGQLRTPPLSEHILASITRAVVIEVTGAVERVTTLTELLDADEAFLASTVREVQPIAEIDGRALASVNGPVSVRTNGLVRARIAELLAQQ